MLLCLYLAVIPFYLWIIPTPFRLYAHLVGTPVLWGLACFFTLGTGHQKFHLLGQRKFWPFVWIPGLFLLPMSFLGIAYFKGLVIFSYGFTRLQAVKPVLLPMFTALLIVLTLGVEWPLRKILLKDSLLGRGMRWPLAMGLCAALGTWRCVPFYWNAWPDPRYLSFAFFNLFLRECTLCRFYLVTENLLACGAYQALLVLIEAFILSDVLGPYLPVFHWVSSSSGFYVLMSCFNLLPFLLLLLVKPTSTLRGDVK